MPIHPGFVALVIIAALGAGLVWAGNAYGWLGAFAASIFLGVLAMLVGGAVGVNVIQSLAVFIIFACSFEGTVYGWACYGWVGAIAGGVTGFLAGHLIFLLPVMLIHIALLLCGIDPFRGGGHQPTARSPQ